MSTTGKLSQESFSQEILELDQKDFPEPWSKEQWLGTDWHHHRLYTWRNPDLSAFAFFGHLTGDDTAHLYKIVVREELRKSGIAHAFWKETSSKLKESGIRQVYLEVNTKNLPAIRFYEKEGFRTLQTKKGFYSDGEDAFIMILTL